MRAENRRVLLVLLGTAGLVLKASYAGPYRDVVHNYGGNIAASFAVYYVAALAVLTVRGETRLNLHPGSWRLLTAGLALLVVELFEALNGFGVMANTYDRLDFAANAVGVALALVVDVVTSGTGRHRARRGEWLGGGQGPVG
jgi:hypothetical protein